MVNLLSSGLVEVLKDLFGPYMAFVILFGTLAICGKISEYQVKQRRTMLFVALFANFMWVLHFIFFGDFPSALTCVIACIRILVFMQKGKRKWADSIWWLILFLILQVVVAIFTFKVWHDAFSLTAGFVGIFAYFVSSPKKYRAISFVYMMLWVINSACKFNIIALISDSMSLISVTVAIIRFTIIEKREKKLKLQIQEKN